MSYKMCPDMRTKRDKLLEKARHHPKGLRFSDFETLLEQCNWTLDHQTGSHRIWYSLTGHRLSVQPTKAGKAKDYQVKQFLLCQEQEHNNES